MSWVAGSTCDDGWSIFNNRCYIWVGEEKTYPDAKSSCQELAATLVTILSNEESDFVRNL